MITRFVEIVCVEGVRNPDVEWKRKKKPEWLKKPEGANAVGNKLERLGQFCRYAKREKWIAADPTEEMKRPPKQHVQKKAYSPNEWKRILAAVEKFIIEAPTPAERVTWMQARVLILFQRFSGLRISDVTACEKGWVKKGRVQLYAIKNGAYIDVALPPNVIGELRAVPAVSENYWFWSGPESSSLDTATKKWHEKFNKIFKAAGIANGSSHRFRDTFAVSMLERGESMQSVADALGITLTVAERHYNPKSKRRQEALDRAVRAAWETGPVENQEEDDAENANGKGESGRVM